MPSSAETASKRPFGLYVHWPFCAAKCPYCDFNSHVAGEIAHDRWADAYVREIRRIADRTGPRSLTSIFFGGGTPSLMQPSTVERVIREACAAWTPDEGIEITLEANPSSVEVGRFRDFKAAGVNRVSIGLQALDDGSLRRLGRMHTAAEGAAALDIARETFERVSFDLIYARQDQTASEWEAELRRALSWTPDHVSLYQLTIEPGTVFGARAERGLLHGLPDEDLGADLYEITQSLTSAAGLPAYEVSNHARGGHASRHNLLYWKSGDYAGIGPGAHGRLTLDGKRLATETILDPNAWLSESDAGVSSYHERALSRSDIRNEGLMMGLRLSDGICHADLARLGIAFDDLQGLSSLVDEDLVVVDSGGVRLTDRGRPLLNTILLELLD